LINLDIEDVYREAV